MGKMVGEAYFEGLVLVAGLIIVGFQFWYIIGLAIEKEIGALRLAILSVISLLAIFLVTGHFFGLSVLISPIFIFFILFLPIIFLKMSQIWEKKHEQRVEKKMIERELWEWEYAALKDPKNRGAFINLGELYLKLGKKEEALRNYRQALLLKPDDPKIEERIRFIEKRMKLGPELTKEDLHIIKSEVKNIPLIFLLVSGGVLSLIFFIYLLTLLPDPAVFVLVVLLPILLTIFWIVRS